MKDALGHGSNGYNGAHAQAMNKLPTLMRVQKEMGLLRTAAGQRDTRGGTVWENVTTPKRRAVAERQAQLQRVDNPNARIRLR
jgi:hypothetical protein